MIEIIAHCGDIHIHKDTRLEEYKKVFEKFHSICMDEQANLAKERGPFSVWNWNKEKDCHYIKILDEGIQKKIKENGRRNISITTIAPTGTLSLLTQTTSGIEPVFKRNYIRRRKLTSDEISKGIPKVDHEDTDGNKWTSYEIHHHGL